MKPFIDQARLYAQYHPNKIILYTHMAGIPLLILSQMIFFGFFQLIVPGIFATTLATIVTLIELIYYFRLNWQLAFLLTPIFLLLLWVSTLISYAGPTHFALWTFVITFVLGWVLQLIGHLLAGSRPAITVNLTQALIAPLFLMAEVCFMMGYMLPIKEQIYGTPDLPER